MAVHWAFLSVGSNLGDPLRNCRAGIAMLCASGQVELSALSPFYWTEPVDYLDQQWFLNAALKIRTTLSPLDLLARLQAAQTALGRKADAIRFGPRLLDLDILFYDEMVMTSDRLTIPHPRMHKRRFVLRPICDIDATIVHPVLQRTVGELLRRLPPDSQKMRPCACDCCCY